MLLVSAVFRRENLSHQQSLLCGHLQEHGFAAICSCENLRRKQQLNLRVRLMLLSLSACLGPKNAHWNMHYTHFYEVALDITRRFDLKVLRD
ncbi:hypothetical protein WJX82_007520 [Trebouxia sp. C0006]